MQLRLFLIAFFLLAGDLFGQSVLNLPRIISNPETFTGLAVSNPTTSPASITFAAFNADGSPLDTPKTVVIPAGGQYARQFSEIFSITGPFNGWLQATSATPGLTGFFLNANFAVTDIDGAGSVIPSSDFVLPVASETSPAKTEVTLVNVNTETAATTATIYASDGSIIATKNISLNGRALVRQTLRQLFGDVDLTSASHIRVKSDRPIVGHEVVADFQIPQVELRRETIAVAGQTPASALAYVLPQFVTGGGWSSYLSVVNASGLSQEVTLTAYKEDGTRWELPANPKKISLAGNASLKTTIEQFFEFGAGQLNIGWIEVRSQLGYVISNIGFGNLDAPSFALVSGVDAAQASRLNVYSHIAEGGGFFTGLTVVNPGREPAAVEFFALRPDGTTVGKFSFTVGPNQRVGKLFRELLPATYEQLGGWALLRASQPVVAAVLFGATNGFGLANVPAQMPAGDFIPPAQTTAAITGTIHQEIFGAEGVTVTLSGPVTSTKRTDASGLYNFAQLPPGEYKISVSRAGAQFFPSERTVTIVRDNVNNIDFDAVGIAPAGAPVITFLTPSSVFGGNSAFNITVFGNNFNQASIVRMNGQDLQTSFISTAELRAAVPAALVRNPGTLGVVVSTPPPGGGSSNRTDLAVNAMPANPLIEGRTGVGAFPAGVAIHPGRKVALVTSQSGDSVSIIDLRNGLKLLGEVKVGRSPAEGIAIHAERDLALVANVGDDNVSVIDLRTNTETTKIKVEDFPTGIAINANTNRAYVVNGESDTVSVIDLSTLAVTGTLRVGRRPSSIAINTQRNIAVVTNRRSNDVTILDLAAGTVLGTVGVGQFPRGVAINPNNNTAIVANANSNNVSIVNIAARTLLMNIDVGVGPTSVAVHLPTNSAVVTNSGAVNGNANFGNTNSVSIINLDTRQIETVPVGAGAFGVDIDTEMQKAVVANYGSNDITVVRLPNPKPAIASVEPKTFPAGGGAFTITVKGTGFLETSVVTLNGQPLPTTFVSSTELRAEVSAALMQQMLQRRGVELLDAKKGGDAFKQVTEINFDVGVSNPGPGGGESPPPSDPAATRIQAQNTAPVLISLDPVQITAGTGDLRLSVSGNGFNATTQLIFATTPHSPLIVSPTAMTVIIPAAELRPGPVAVSVTNPPPGGGTTAALTFTVLENTNPAPTITGVSPAELPAGSSAARVRVTGSGFISGTALTIEGNTVPATLGSGFLEFTIAANQLQTPATLRGLISNPAPGGGAATFNINVLNPAPTVSSFSPQTAVVGAAALEVRVVGSRFGPNSLVTVEGTPVQTRVVSAEELRGTLTATMLAQVGRLRIGVSNPPPGGGLVEAGALSVAPEPVNPVPEITALNPAVLQLGQTNTTITVTGTGFANRAVVSIDGTAATTTVISETTLRFIMASAARAGVANITVSNPPPGGGVSAPAALQIHNPAPTLISISPKLGPSGTTATLTVTGSGFIEGAVINFGGQRLTTTFVNGGSLTAVVNLSSPGPQPVTVTNPGPGGGTSASMNFEVTAALNPIPTISAVVPSFVGAGVATLVEIQGTNFVGGAAVSIDTTLLPQAVVQSSNSIVVKLPELPPGNHSVVVSNPGPGGGSSNSFTIRAVTSPMVDSISPGILAPGSAPAAVTVTGANFGASTSAVGVSIGSTQITPSSVTSTAVTFTVPSAVLASEGTLSVVVRVNGVPSNAVSLSVRHFETFATGLSNPKDIVGNSRQELFVANAGTGTVLKVSPTGSVSAFASGFSVGGPSGLALASNGDLFVADNLQGTISRVTSNGTVTTFATGLTKPNDIVFDAAGNLLVANAGDATIRRITPAGIVSTAATLTGLTPFGLAVSGNEVFVSDYTAGQIVKLDGESASTIAFMNKLSDGLTADSAGRLFVGNGAAGTLDRIDADGRVAHISSGITANGPIALTVDSAGVLLTAFNDRLIRFASSVSTSPEGAPYISRIEPPYSAAGRTFSASVLGSGLANASALNFSSNNLSAVVGGGGTNATLPATVTIVSSAPPQPVTFTAATPLGATNARAFDIVGTPNVSAISPDTTSAESDSFSLTVTGANFHNDAMVQFGSTTLAAATRTSSQLTAVVPTSAVLTIETVTVAVKSGGAVSNGLPFVIKTPVTSVTISPWAPVLTSFGAKHQFQAVARNSAAETISGKTFAWASSNTSIASVDNTGLVTGAGNGEATITATVDGVSATAAVKVDQTVATITVSPASATLSSVDATQPFSTELKDANGNTVTNKAVTWSSTATGVASVNSNGIATAVASGTAEIKATVGDKSASASLTVTQAVAAIEVSPATTTLQSLNVTQAFTATAKDAKGKVISGKTFTWSSDNTAFVSITSSGIATSIGDSGSTAVIIRAKTDGKEGTATISVAQKVGTIQVTADSTTIASINGTQQFRAAVKDAAGQSVSGKTVNWSSDKPEIATVDSNGLVKAVSNGSALIKATVDGASGDLAVTVDQVVHTVTVTPAEKTLTSINDTEDFEVVLKDALGNIITGKTVAWSSTNTDVAVVDSASGLATAKKDGTTEIKATIGSKNAAAKLSVAQAVSTVQISPESKTFTSLQETATFTVTVKDAKGNTITGKTIEWKSEAAPTVSVDANGLAKALANGAATIKATVGDRTASAVITVAQAVHTVTIAPAAKTFASFKETQTFTVTVKDALGNVVDKALSWSSSKTEVATIASSGAVSGVATAVADGEAVVTVSAGDKSATATITVTQAVNKVTVTPGSYAFSAKDQTLEFAAAAEDALGNPVLGKAVTWSSSSSGTASVNTTGVVTAVGDGSSTITAAIGGKSATAAVTVAQSIASVSLSPDAKTLVSIGETFTLTLSVTDAKGNTISGAGATWTSSHPNFATVNNGVVEAKANGSTTITASVGDKSASAQVIVSQAVDSVEIALDTVGAAIIESAEKASSRNVLTPTLRTYNATAATPFRMTSLGDALQFKALVKDARGNLIAGKVPSWNSDKADLTEVDATGKATGRRNGSAKITATVEGKSAVADVVVEQVVASVDVEPLSKTFVSFGETQPFRATPKDARGNPVEGKTPVWTATGAISVDTAGVVTAGNADGDMVVTATIDGKAAPIAVKVAQEAASVTISPDTKTITTLGNFQDFSAVARDARGNLVNKPVEWSTSHPSLASINASGRATGHGNGRVTITAKVGSKSGFATVIIAQGSARIDLSKGSHQFSALRRIEKVIAKFFDTNGNEVSKSIVWSSDNEAVAAVNPSTGDITAVGNGTATITATAEGVSASVTIVVAQSLHGIVISEVGSGKLKAFGHRRKFTAQAVDPDGHPIAGKKASWRSSDDAIASIDGEGEATAKLNGSVVLTALIDDKSATASLNVDQEVDSIISLTGSGSLKALNRGRQYKAVDANGNAIAGKTIVWSSSADGVATVDNAGNAKAKGNGNARIFAAVDGKSVSADLEVSQEVTSVQLTADTTGKLGALKKRRQFTAKAKDPDGYDITGKTVTWTTSDGTVASIDTSGLATAEKNGRARIKAVIDGIASSESDIEIEQVTRTVQVTGDNSKIPALNRKRKFTAKAKDENGFDIEGKTATWSSTNGNAVPVDASGEVTARTNGNSDVKAMIDGIEGTLTISVDQVIHRLEAAETGKLKALNRTRQFKALDADGNLITGKTIVWSPSSTDIATVDSNGIAKARGNGIGKIRATVDGNTVEADLEVSQEVTSIEVTADSTGKLGALKKQRKFSAKAKDPDGYEITGKTVVWKTSDATIASLAADGTATAEKNGRVTVKGSIDGVESQPLDLEIQQVTSRVEVSGDNSRIPALNRKRKFTAKAKDENGFDIEGKTATWSSTNAAVPVDSVSGEITAKGNGNSTVKAVIDGIEGSTALTVDQEIDRLQATETGKLKALNRTRSFVAVDADGNPLSGKTITWSSSDAATVSVAGGVATAKKNGSAKALATVDGKTVESEVTVEQEVRSVELSGDTSRFPSFNIKRNLTAVVKDLDGYVVQGRTPAFSSTNGTALPIDPSTGEVTSKKNGTGSITASVDGIQSNSIGLEVSQVVSIVEPLPGEKTGKFTSKSETRQYVAKDAGGSVIEKAVTWRVTGDTPVASVDSTGKVTARQNKRGKTTSLTATVEGTTVSSDIDVEQIAVRIEITRGALTLPRIGRKTTFEAVAYDGGTPPEVVEDKSITWSVSNPAVATISASGALEAVGLGTTKVRATMDGITVEVELRVSLDL